MSDNKSDLNEVSLEETDVDRNNCLLISTRKVKLKGKQSVDNLLSMAERSIGWVTLKEREEEFK